MKISASFLKIQNQKENIEKLNYLTDYMHFDIMDGIFVSNKTIDFDEMVEVTKNITKPKDIHLMVKDIIKYVDLYKQLNPNYITFHFEATNNIEETINYIKENNIKVGLAINPDTDVHVLKNYLDKVDLILVMSVFPGKGGQEFIDITDKLVYLYNYRKENNYHYIIEVDGGINNKTIKKVTKADIAVVGSYITDASDYQAKFQKVRDIDE